MSDRSAQVATVEQSLEEDLDLLCITGVEDQLQVKTNGRRCITDCGTSDKDTNLNEDKIMCLLFRGSVLQA